MSNSGCLSCWWWGIPCGVHERNLKLGGLLCVIYLGGEPRYAWVERIYCIMARAGGLNSINDRICLIDYRYFEFDTRAKQVAANNFAMKNKIGLFAKCYSSLTKTVLSSAIKS